MSHWAGFSRLRTGKIHVFCPRCKRKLSNMPRQDDDPKSAELVHCCCERCSSGCKDVPQFFFNGRGKRVVMW